ncbi:transposase [Anatilimnocola sp. NA78]|uniref:transposase n=1 Tax=Anatilimnocola sp. NA78 TaxID=3415683 RepID=UPI003CE46357
MKGVMAMGELWPVELFDPAADVEIVERNLPHWSQAGTITFITFRTHDSLPTAVIERWLSQRDAWLRQHDIDASRPDWKRQLSKLDSRLAREFRDAFWNRWHDALDSCHGNCELRNAKLAKIVADSLQHFDDVRYQLVDYVVMPNHVHLLCSFANATDMLAQCDSWKHFTAVQINRQLGRSGRLWQQDAFDHLVRSEEQFQFLRHYIAANPTQAQLQTGEFLHYSRPQP